MSRWAIVLWASGLSYLVKLAGYVVPPRLVEGHRSARVVTLLPIALLAALVVVQTFGGSSGDLTIDARLAALGVAVLLLLARANFLVVVVAAAAVAAALRALGMA